MLKRYHHVVGGIFRLVDVCVIGIAWLMAYWFRFYLPLLEVTKGRPSFQGYAALSIPVIAIWMIVFTYMRVYQSRRMLRRTDEVHLILRAHGTALLFFIALTYLISEYKYSRAVIVYFGVIGAFLLIFFRLVLRNSLREVRRLGFNLRHVIGVGEGGAIETLIQRIDKFPELGLRVVGIVTHENSSARLIQGKPVVGAFNEIQAILKKYKPDQLLIALPRHQYADLDRILSLIREETIDIQLVPDIHEYVTLGCEIEDFEGLPIVNINDCPLSGWNVFLKRLTDILISSAALIFLFPLLFLIALAIKLTSKGPIFFTQERMGLDGRTFKMLKFRSMQVDAESGTGAVWARPNDIRRTPFGGLLRGMSIDELPQLWNVFRGDMSLVGPRPERPVFVYQFRKEIPNYMLRHKVKSGITGWAQINGWRGNTSLDRRIECDLYYIRNWSYYLDLKIILLTFLKGFVNKNAY
jgi:Undecaprenyl-phosphate glucose phosphotransferase